MNRPQVIGALGVLATVLCVTGVGVPSEHGDVLRVGNLRQVGEIATVSLYVEASHDLVALDIPIRFGKPGDRITLEEVEWAPQFAGWDVANAQIDNAEKTVILGLVAQVVSAKPHLAMKAVDGNHGKIADLRFSVDDVVPSGFSTFTTTRPTHTLSYIHNRWVRDVPYVEVTYPRFGSEVSFSKSALPLSYALHQNYPNPFNAETNVQFTVPVDSRVRLDVINVLGQHVRKLADERYGAGTHSVRWDGRNDQGGSVASGIYFIHMRADEFEGKYRMTLLK